MKVESQLATSTDDVAAAALNELRRRGVTNPDEFAHLDAESVYGTVRWYDAQNGRVGPGVLVAELRAGGKPGWQERTTMLDRELEYGRSIAVWLEENFPDLKDTDGSPHPAAVAAVIRLHYLHGKGQLRKSEHGGEIRAAVKAFNRKWGL